jgi:hypothetical protein
VQPTLAALAFPRSYRFITSLSAVRATPAATYIRQSHDLDDLVSPMRTWPARRLFTGSYAPGPCRHGKRSGLHDCVRRGPPPLGLKAELLLDAAAVLSTTSPPHLFSQPQQAASKPNPEFAISCGNCKPFDST